MFECGFIYVAGGLDPVQQRAVIPSSEINMNVIGCSNYQQACEAAKELVAKGCTAIELCAGFGYEGIAMVKEAVGPGIWVGAVKFDCHPAFDFKSGDDMFKQYIVHTAFKAQRIKDRLTDIALKYIIRLFKGPGQVM